MKKTLATLALGATVSIGAVASRRQRTPDGIMAFRSLQSSAAWRQGQFLAQHSRPQGPITTLTRTSPSISDHDVMYGMTASGTDGVGTFTVSRIATE
jgi:hypothetical protein